MEDDDEVDLLRYGNNSKISTKLTEVATLHNTEVEEMDINLPEEVMNHQEVVTLEQADQGATVHYSWYPRRMVDLELYRTSEN